MPEIEITEEQSEYLEALRREIQNEVVGKYAQVRPVDALQYLIDSYEGDVTGPGPASIGSGTGEVGADAVESQSAATDEGATAGDSEETTTDAPMATAGGDDSMLSAMMKLLDTYDDKWTNVEGDTGYRVDLPDGSTETANTRDDVKALLFKHYE